MKREHIWIHHELDATRYWKQAEGGYGDRMSVKQGESLDLHVSNSHSYYDIEIIRVGARREHVTTIENLRGALHEVPELGYQDGFGWPVAATLKVGDDWRSGIYVAQLATGQGIREIFFVVRPKEPRSPMLLTLATNTYNAYNNVGGKSCYDYISTDRERARLVSFQRPLQAEMLGNFYAWDQFFTSWLDAEDFEVDYATNMEHDAEPGLLAAYKANLRIGHDEYNTRGELEQLQQFMRDGGNLILFAGNCFFHEVEYRDNFTKLYCHKLHNERPPTPGEKTQYWSYIDQMRQRTIGNMYTGFVHAKSAVPGEFIAAVTDGGRYGYFKVTRDDHWAFAGTGLRNGDVIGADDSIAGVEVDAGDIEFVDGKPRYTGADGVSPNYEIVAIADAILQDDRYAQLDGSGTGEMIDCHGTVAVNETEFAGTVFNAGTIEWGHGLYRDDSPVAQITRNVLNRLGR